MRQFSNVLLVDDDDIVRRRIAITLKREGFEVVEGENGREGLELVQKHCPDYLITDWNMPEMDGRELCEHVRRMDLPHHVHIIFVTAYSESVDIIMALAAGADDYITKPIDTRELVARMDAGTRVLQLERKLRFEASHDVLTGVPNRRTFVEAAEREIARAKRYGSPLSMLFMDIDHFKTVNDSFGHLVGDKVLINIGRVLLDKLRNCDFICRYGGEEFCVLLPETPLQGAMVVAERLRAAIHDTPTTWEGNNSLSVTVSLGVAEYSAGIAADLIRAADSALYEAKNSGRNKVLAASALPDAHCDFSSPQPSDAKIGERC